MSEEKQATYAYLLALVLFAGVVFTFFVLQERYTHERPAVDCARPYDYPACWLAERWTAAPEPSRGAQFTGLGIVGVLALIIIVWGWKASVTREEEIAAPSNAPAAGNGASAQPLPAFSPAAEPVKKFPHGRTPETIPGNPIPREMITTPTAAPKKAPDLKKLEGEN